MLLEWDKVNELSVDMKDIAQKEGIRDSVEKRRGKYIKAIKEL